MEEVTKIRKRFVVSIAQNAQRRIGQVRGLTRDQENGLAEICEEFCKHVEEVLEGYRTGVE